MALPSQEELHQLLTYDPDVGILKWKSKPGPGPGNDDWNNNYAGHRAFTSVSAEGYMTGKIDGVLYKAAQVIFCMIHGYEPIQVDHINGDRMDDRECNLREVTPSENQMNKKRATNNTSGVVGVSWCKRTEMWMAYITVKKKQMFLGRFDNKDNAILQRKEAEEAWGFHPNHGRRI